jgi:hypothetical protein
MFLDYLPSEIGYVFITSGIWGWIGVVQHFSKTQNQKEKIPQIATLISILVVIFFSAFRMATDIRYVLTCSLPLLYHLRQTLASDKDSLGGKKLFFATYVVVSLFTNVYNLNTSEARWSAAKELQESGVSPKEISAGYGHDAFTLEHECITKILSKLSVLPDPIWKDPQFNQRIISRFGRSYSDEWVPRYILKPSTFFGHKLNLSKNRLEGQSAEPTKYFVYSVFGFKNELALFENSNPVPAWCDR